MRIASIVVLAVSLMSADLRAQSYSHSVGIRVGNYIAADYKCFVSPMSSLGVTFGVVNPFCAEYQFITLSPNYCINFRTGLGRLRPYIGGGLSFGVQFGDKDRERLDRISYFMSADLPVGVEYNLKTKPVVFVLEWTPKFQFLSDLRFLPQSVSVGFRFTFPRR